MRIDHIALWTNDLERCKRFYVFYFGVTAGSGYGESDEGL
jgi:lactoylglutathione lyase